MVVATEITGIKQEELRLREAHLSALNAAETDFLTGMSNRRSCMKAAEDSLRELPSAGRVDAGRRRRCVRVGDDICRLGPTGDRGRRSRASTSMPIALCTQPRLQAGLPSSERMSRRDGIKADTA